MHYLAVKMTAVVNGLVVFPARMLQNLEASRGVWAGNRVRNALLSAGVDPNAAYEYVQRCSFEAIDNGQPLAKRLRENWLTVHDARTAADIIGGEKLAALFDARAYIERGINHIFGKETA